VYPGGGKGKQHDMDGPRHDGRAADALRPIKLTPGFLKHPPGSVLIEMGETRVLCTATVEDKTPAFLHGSGEGWVTGEYAMIPAATDTRTQREATRGRLSGRTQEIQRLIGRALRSVVDRKALGERTIWVDCEVLQADGGTRTAAITGGFVALALALHKLQQERLLRGPALVSALAAVSVGIVEGRPVLDLNYAEDSGADVDMNVARTDDGRYVEVQSTAESVPFRRDQLEALLDLADRGIERLHREQREALGAAFGAVRRQ
jgi:ribonuclease PH